MEKTSCNKKIKKSKVQGFTLVELMVSVSIFSFVMLISMGAIMTILDANRKSQTLRSVMDNLNFALEGMTRTIRFGDTYHCGGGDITETHDCITGDTSMSVKASDGKRVTYALSGASIAKSEDGGTTYYPVTSPDVIIQNVKFYVTGSDQYSLSDLSQPKVIVVVRGYAGTKESTKSSFILETTMSQRKLDFQ